MKRRNKIKLNIRFSGDKVSCAKSLELCKGCSNYNICEYMELYYYPYDGAIECMKHDSYKRVNGAIKQRE